MTSVTVTNTTGRLISPPVGPSFPPESSTTTTRAQLEHIDNRAYLARYLKSGSLEVTETVESQDGESVEVDLSREGIAKLKKADLVDLLAQHGAATEGTADELRERALAVIFADL